jgi:septal ring factor EnvC (AmiA/AmiB activator)
MGIMPAMRLLLAALPLAAAASSLPLEQGEEALVQTWGEALDGSMLQTNSKDTPVTRVVNLLKEMQGTLQKEMDEDAALYDKLACWCNTNEGEKGTAISEAEAKISDLTSTIESLTAKTAELTETIKQLEADAAAGKEALASATALREKEAKEFQGQETEAMVNIKNLEAAILVLSKHHGGALPQLPRPEDEKVSFLSRSTGKKGRGGRALMPWDSDRESSISRSFDQFMEQNGFDAPAAGDSTTAAPAAKPKPNLLQDQSAGSGADATVAWTASETAILQKAMKSANAFVQARQGEGEEYYPSYGAQSGEIFGMLKQLKDEMTAQLGEAQKTEVERQSNFNELRSSKQAEIAAAEKQAEEKEDQLAEATMGLAEAKEDLGQTESALSEAQKFMANLKTTCQDADKNFEERKSARLEEIKAVADTIAILTSDEARDTLSATYNGAAFVQLSSRSRKIVSVRQQAAKLLRGVAAKSPQLAILATRVELDSFGRVKQAIDDMTAQLKVQQADEVKKHDWCNSEIHSNEMATTKTEDLKAGLDMKVDDLSGDISKLEDEIKNSKGQIANLQLDLQRATENRQKENLDFQKTIADQRATQDILKTALERLAKYYDEEFIQTKGSKQGAEALLQKGKGKQTPPVPQMEYSKSSGSTGVMSMIEKLIMEAKELEADAVKGESAAQAQYETLVADTNSSIKGLMQDIASKTSMRAQAAKEKAATEGDLKGAAGELEDLGQYNADLHSECDYLVKNFGTRQEARSQEIEALQQAKQILSGASLS